MNPEINTTIELSNDEIATLFTWYENDIEIISIYGSLKAFVPEEEILVSKIRESSSIL